MNIAQRIVISLFPILYALTIHEASHGFAAFFLGDDTAQQAGRLSFNPLKHLDPLGTIMLFVAHIGWAKPVPINPYNFKNFKRDTALVALAGPAANFISAMVFGLIFSLFGGNIYTMQTNILLLIIFYTIFFNVALGIFNLIPIPPLDGSKILGAFLDDRAYYKYQQFERKGMFLLIAIIVVGNIMHIPIISSIIMPPIRFCIHLFTGISF